MVKIRTDREEVRVVIDSREQLPWDLAPLDARIGTLATGDYGLLDFPGEVSIERKELSDFIGCIGHGRPRFQRELDRLKGFNSHCVIIEASYADLREGNWRSKVTPHMVMQSICSWTAKGNSFVLAGDRETAQELAKSILYHAFKNRIEPAKRVIKTLTKKAKELN